MPVYTENFPLPFEDDLVIAFDSDSTGDLNPQFDVVWWVGLADMTGSHFMYLYDVAGKYVPIFSGSGHDPGYLVHGEYPDLVKSERLRIAYLYPGNISWYRYRRR